MKKVFLLFSLSFPLIGALSAQTELDLINAVSLDSLNQTLQEFT